MGIYKQTEPALRSWDCKGCTNLVFIEKYGAWYCRPMVENRHRKEWQDNVIVCLDKTTAPFTGGYVWHE